MKHGTIHQGDVNFIPLAAFGKNLSVNRSKPIRREENRLLIQEGEATGHYHGIWLMPQPVMFRDDAIARSMESSSPVALGASLYQDDDLFRRLDLDPGAPVIGFLVVDTDVEVRHTDKDGKPTNEHSAVHLSRGEYLVTGKREQIGADVRRVQD